MKRGLPLSSSTFGDTTIFLPCTLSGIGSSLRWPSSRLTTRPVKLTFRFPLKNVSEPPRKISDALVSLLSLRPA